MSRHLAAWSAVLSLCAVLTSAPAVATSYPENSPVDHRIKTVIYNPANTVTIDAVTGLAVHIVVSPDEKYVTHVFGDGKAWAFAHVGNSYFVKPTSADFPDTNLVIVTNKRSYNILLRSTSTYAVKGPDGQIIKKPITVPWAAKVATVQVTYQYPHEEARKAAKEAEAAREKAEIAGALQSWKNAGPLNWNYRMSDGPKGDGIRPLNVWDNYRFTFFRFPANATLPTLFVIAPDGKDSIANVSVQGENHDVLAVHTVAKEWRIRYGDQVVGVVNDDYDPSKGANPSGTDSPDVKRVLEVTP